ncbi:MAG: phage integrase N-terminal SAM-like domain-containing protein [Methyloprofundus sp.]|nr:phage integrase N-terminal SAM-like domain-containing protein [Methyloprofundus sp.]
MSTLKPGKSLLEEMRDTMQRLHYAIHTERSYCDWVGRYIRFHHLQERSALLIEPERKVEDFLMHLAVQANIVRRLFNFF